jgi:hypothetical protein
VLKLEELESQPTADLDLDLAVSGCVFVAQLAVELAVGLAVGLVSELVGKMDVELDVELVVGLVVALAGDLGRELAVELASELASSHFVKLVVVMRTVLALQVVVDIELGLASARMVHCAQLGAGRGLEAGRELVAGRELGVACPPSQ